MNLKFLGILNEKRKNSELKELISIGTCGLHTIHRAFQHGGEASTWDMKKLLGAMFKLFDESPSRRADYERVTSAENESDFPLRFCSHRWVENEIVARRAQVIWPKIVEVVKYWKTLPKSKQPGQGKPEINKSYQTLLKNYTDPMVLLRLTFFEEVSRKLNKFRRRFQADAPMAPFLVDTIEEVLRDFCRKFILDDVLKKAEKTLDLVNHILQKLVNTQHISSEFADESKVQYAAFLQNIVKAEKTNFRNYSIDDNKLDEFFIGYVEDHARYSKFAEIMKIVLTLSHGQASVERGFSVNKNLLVENLQESSLIAQRRVVDYMDANCLIQSVRNSYKKYSLILLVAEKRKENVQKEKQKKAQLLSSEISSLEKKKILLEASINDLQKESDKLGFEAEKASKLDLLKFLVTKSNALKHAANDKQLELEECIEKKRQLLEAKEKILGS